MKNLRALPAIDQLKRDHRFATLLAAHDLTENVLTDLITAQVSHLRQQLLAGDYAGQTLDRAQLTALIFTAVTKHVQTTKYNNLRPVINATGVVLHTNLGRARLSDDAITQITETAASYSTLEYDVATGQRGSRHDLVEEHLQHLTGAEAAMVVNNNAAAVYLVLKALAQDKEVIVSRGELVEIGGSFRISEIMAESQAILVDVGTTNKTHVRDYEQAITDETALLMKVHKSNFKLIGFTAEVATEALTELARLKQIPIYEDLGSGTLFDFKQHQIGDEPTVQEKVAAGIDLISFSGDKLLGGPQAGIIVGKARYIDQLKQHQLARVLRVDKFTLAGLEATLKAYINEQAVRDVPTVRDIIEPSASILKRAEAFIDAMTANETGWTFSVIDGVSKIGGGTMPDVELATAIVEVRREQQSSAALAAQLRAAEVPVIVRVQHDTVMLDFRTIAEAEVPLLVQSFKNMAGSCGN